MNNKAVEQACETMLGKKQWQTPEVVVLSSDNTEFGGLNPVPDATTLGDDS